MEDLLNEKKGRKVFRRRDPHNLQLAMELVDEARNTAEDAKAGTMSG